MACHVIAHMSGHAAASARPVLVAALQGSVPRACGVHLQVKACAEGREELRGVFSQSVCRSRCQAGRRVQRVALGRRTQANAEPTLAM